MEKHLEAEICFDGAARGEFEKAVKNHIEIHKGVTFVDVVKFLYQSIMGTHHILDHMDDHQIQTWLKEQLESANPANRSFTELLFGDRWVRLDLAAFKHRYGVDYRLAARLFLTGKSVKRTGVKEFSQAMEKLNRLVSNHKIRSIDSHVDLASSAVSFLETYKHENFPPLHHSESYTKQNPPYIIIPAESVALLEGNP